MVRRGELWCDRDAGFRVQTHFPLNLRADRYHIQQISTEKKDKRQKIGLKEWNDKLEIDNATPIQLSGRLMLRWIKTDVSGVQDERFWTGEGVGCHRDSTVASQCDKRCVIMTQSRRVPFHGNVFEVTMYHAIQFLAKLMDWHVECRGALPSSHYRIGFFPPIWF